MALRPEFPFGPYQVLSLLGAGGMGSVYLAIDRRLGRKVALKLLPDVFTRDTERLRRFQQEARAASALNHPNIVTIHEIGVFEDIHYIATEFINGETLRQRMAEKLELTKALDIAAQVAVALAAAHASGIMHRDIKPENVMLRNDGYVKVLDFGLAKLTGPPSGPVGSAVPTAGVKTDTGVVLGTVHYMSPEQARAIDVDPRTDIFSLGVLLYEMVAGVKPFAGTTPSDVLAAILTAEPVPLASRAPGIPVELQRIVSKCLAKDREERYQGAKDVQIDLKNLKQDLDIGRRVGSAPALVATAPEVPRVRWWRKVTVFTVLAGLVVSAIGLAWWAYDRFRPKRDVPAFQSMKLARLTTHGAAGSSVAISPDGRYVAYVRIEKQGQSLQLRQVATTSNVELIPPGPAGLWPVQFSRDGNYLYFVRQNALYHIPVLGGSPRKLIGDISSSPALSPDERKIAIVREDKSQGEVALILSSFDGSPPTKIATRRSPVNVVAPSWSPDGTTIAFAAGEASGGLTLIRAQVGDGSERVLSAQEWFWIADTEWLSDQSGLVFAARDSPPFQIWLLDFRTGKARRVTNDLGDYRVVSLTTDGRALATVSGTQYSNIWVAPDGDSRLAHQVSAAYEGQGVSWTRDGRIVYESKASGNPDIWIMNPDGSGQTQLTVDPHYDGSPEVAPDGRYVLFVSNRTGARNIFRMDLDGENQRQLTSGKNDVVPKCSPDGKWVVYSGRDATQWDVRKVSIEGGDPVALTVDECRWPAVSPDGTEIACMLLAPGSPLRLAVIPFEGGRPKKTFSLPSTVSTLMPDGIPAWARDGKSVLYLDTRGGVSNLWSQPLDGRPALQVTRFDSERIWSFAWSNDGTTLAFARGGVKRDVVLIRDFR